MQAAVMYKPGDIRLEEVPKPAAKKGEALLMIAARRNHLVETVWPALERGDWVICDRFADSTVAYQPLALGVALTVQYGQVTHRALLFDGLYVADELSWALKLAGFLVVAVALLYSRSYLENRAILRGESDDFSACAAVKALIPGRPVAASCAASQSPHSAPSHNRFAGLAHARQNVSMASA